MCFVCVCCDNTASQEVGSLKKKTSRKIRKPLVSMRQWNWQTLDKQTLFRQAGRELIKINFTQAVFLHGSSTCSCQTFPNSDSNLLVITLGRRKASLDERADREFICFLKSSSQAKAVYNTSTCININTMSLALLRAGFLF